MPESKFFEILQRHATAGGPEMQVCKLCREFPWDKLPSEDDRALPHKASLEALTESADQCPLCMLILWAAGCVLAGAGGMACSGTDLFLPSGRKVEFIALESNRNKMGMNAQENGAVFTSFTMTVEPDLRVPRMEDPYDCVADPQAVRPWLFGNWYQSPLSHRKEPQLIGLGVRLGTGADIERAIGNTEKNVTLYGSYIRIRTDDDSCMAAVVPGRLRTHDQQSSIAFERLETNLKWCDDHHTCLPASNHVKPLPSRVLHVSPNADSTFILLEETRGSTGLYIALSHCWGTSHRITTTKATLEAHKHGIALARLPQTFKDAVKITRKLGIRYLWIDSLCIVQDDAADWEYEASLMGKVYFNAYVTISALSSKDDSSGCFANQDTRSPQQPYVSCDTRSTLRRCLPHTSPTVIPVPTEDSPYGKAYHRYMNFAPAQVSQNNQASFIYFTFEWMPPSINILPQTHLIGEFGAVFDPIDDEPLSKRAWTLQERLLSPRTIHYSNKEMYFECQAGVIAEDGAILPRVFPRLRALVELSCRDRQDLWHKLIEEYSSRNLTRESDKLPAISGVAQMVASATNDKYCAGLWLRDIVEELCWSVEIFEPSHHCDDPEHDASMPPPEKKFYGYPQEYRAPSWSWASLDAKITHQPLERKELLTTCVEVQVEAAGRDPYGRVKSGRIILKGPVSELRQRLPTKGDRSTRHPYTIPVATEDVHGQLLQGTASFDGEIRFPCSVLFLDHKKTLILRRTSQSAEVFTRIGTATFYHWDPRASSTIITESKPKQKKLFGFLKSKRREREDTQSGTGAETAISERDAQKRAQVRVITII